MKPVSRRNFLKELLRRPLEKLVRPAAERAGLVKEQTPEDVGLELIKTLSKTRLPTSTPAKERLAQKEMNP
jgi:hypothetical protein